MGKGESVGRNGKKTATRERRPAAHGVRKSHLDGTEWRNLPREQALFSEKYSLKTRPPPRRRTFAGPTNYDEMDEVDGGLGRVGSRYPSPTLPSCCPLGPALPCFFESCFSFAFESRKCATLEAAKPKKNYEKKKEKEKIAEGAVMRKKVPHFLEFLQKQKKR